MTRNDKILLDANIFIALANTKDSHHPRVAQRIEELQNEKLLFFTNNHVVDEVLTVTARRTQSITAMFPIGDGVYRGILPWFRVYRSTISWEKEAFVFFRKQPEYQKETFLAFTDCVLLVQAKRQAITALWTLDACLAARCKQEHIALL